MYRKRKCVAGEMFSQINIRSRKCLVGEMSSRGNSRSGKCLVREMPSQGSVGQGIDQSGMCQSGKCRSEKCPVGEVSGQRFQLLQFRVGRITRKTNKPCSGPVFQSIFIFMFLVQHLYK